MCIFPRQVSVCFGINTVLFNNTYAHSCVFPPTGVCLFWDKHCPIQHYRCPQLCISLTGVCLFRDKHCPIQHYRRPQLCISLTGVCLFRDKHCPIQHYRRPQLCISLTGVCFGINTVLFNTTDVHSCVFPWQVPVCFWTNSTLPLLIWTCLIEAHHQRGCAFKGCWLPLTRSSSLLMEWTASFSLDRTAVSLFTPLLVGRFAETSNKFLLFGWNAPGLSNNFGADHDSNCLASLSWNLFSLLKIDAWKPW